MTEGPATEPPLDNGVHTDTDASSAQAAEERHRDDARGDAQDDALRGSRTSGTWVFLALLVVLLLLIATFVLQNTQKVEISFLWWTGSAPLAAALLIATALGLMLAVVAGTLRILQLRRRVRRERKARTA